MNILGLKITRSTKSVADLGGTTDVVAMDSRTTIERAMGDYFGDGAFINSGVTQESSLSIAAVWRAVNVIAGTIATLPIHVIQKQGDSRVTLNDHYVSRLLHRPNGYQTKSQFFKTLLAHLLLWGNGYALIERDKYFRPVALYIYHPSKVSVRLVKGEVKYNVQNIREELDAWDVIHLRGLALDGLVGKSPIALHRENLDLAKSSLQYGAEFFTKGGNTSGVYEVPTQLNDETYKRMVDKIKAKTSGLNNAHEPLLLEGGLKYTRINIPLEDAQFIATRKFQATEIARIFGVPPHMIGDLDRATNNNIEQQAIEFVTYCLGPYLTEIKEELQFKLFTEAERDVHAAFNLNAILRGDQAARSKFYRDLFYIGVMTPNKILELEDMNGYQGGDEHFIQANMTKVNKIDNEPKN